MSLLFTARAAARPKARHIPGRSAAIVAAFFLTSALTPAQTAGPALTVDAASAHHAINPNIYGVNEYNDTSNADGTVNSNLGHYPIPVRRWGGDNSATYNWKLDANNLASNYFFEDFPLESTKNDPVIPAQLPNGSTFDKWVARNRRYGAASIATVPITGWVAGTRTPKVCSFDLTRYPGQATVINGVSQVDPWATNCATGLYPNGTAVKNDPHDAYTAVGSDFATNWVKHVVEQYGTAAQGGVWLWELDNEPVYWNTVHKDIHPTAAGFDEVLSKGMEWAAAIKAADPTAKVGGPSTANWGSLFYSAVDNASGYATAPDYKFWNNPTDRNSHQLDFVPWYLQQMKIYESQKKVRLLDYLDVHAYLAPDGMPSTRNPSRPDLDTLRLTSTRVFWDATYLIPREDVIGMNTKYSTGAPQLIPRLKKWIADEYPGTMIAITEYNWGAMDDITGFLAQVDLFGIFGREGVDLATVWDPPGPTQPGSFAWRMYLDYDGSGRAFGETSVACTTANPDQLSAFASLRKDGALTVMVLNKTTSSLKSSLKIANFADRGTAQVWTYGQQNLTSIQRGADIAVKDKTMSMVFPAYTATLLVLEGPPRIERPAPGGLTGPGATVPRMR